MKNTTKRHKLSDRERKKIIADYVECGNYSETARRNGVTDTTVRNLCKENEATLKNFEQKAKQNTKDFIAEMEKNTERVLNIIDKVLSVLNDPKRIDTASNKDLMTIYGVLVDKYINLPRRTEQQDDKPDGNKITVVIKDNSVVTGDAK